MDLLKVPSHCCLLVQVLVIKKFLTIPFDTKKLHLSYISKNNKLIYDNCTIYLNRKYEKFIYFRQLYEISYRPIQTNIGEGCDANTEITTETKESVAS